MNIYVGNPPFTITEDKLKDLFVGFGEITRINLITDRATGEPRGFGFVEMPKSQLRCATEFAQDWPRAAGRSRSGLLPGAEGAHPNRRLTQMKQPPRKSVRFIAAHHRPTPKRSFSVHFGNKTTQLRKGRPARSATLQLAGQKRDRRSQPSRRKTLRALTM